MVGDGARVNREGGAAKVAATRLIIDCVDWPYQVFTNFQKLTWGLSVGFQAGWIGCLSK